MSLSYMAQNSIGVISSEAAVKMFWGLTYSLMALFQLSTACDLEHQPYQHRIETIAFVFLKSSDI